MKRLWRKMYKHMVERGDGGVLVGTASLAAIEGAPRNEHYAASKGGVVSMVKALAALTCKPDCALIDGNQPIPGPLFRRGKFPGGQSLYQQTIVKGDQVCISIAAASILAKVARDHMMVELDKQYPQYGFASHKGYSCPAHFAALRCHGPSPIHRQSFKPVREAATVRDGRAGPLFES